VSRDSGFGEIYTRFSVLIELDSIERLKRVSFLIGANKIAPKKCLDCDKKLPKPVHGDYPAQAKLSYIIDRGWFIQCDCGAWYQWAFDDTRMNGGVWKRRHIMPIFDDRLRIELTDKQKSHGVYGKGL
jgi:hypothetical protein